MRMPTKDEINPHAEDLDGRFACEHFFGKNIEQAEALFRENPLQYQEDLMWMGPVAFRYYVQAAINFIQFPQEIGQTDFIGGFCGTLEYWLQFKPNDLKLIARELAASCRYVLDNYERLDPLPKNEEERKTFIEALSAAFDSMRDVLADKYKAEEYMDLRTRFTTLEQAFAKMVD